MGTRRCEESKCRKSIKKNKKKQKKNSFTKSRGLLFDYRFAPYPKYVHFIPKDLFIRILKNDELEMEEITVWGLAIAWAKCQDATVSQEPKDAEEDDDNDVKMQEMSRSSSDVGKEKRTFDDFRDPLSGILQFIRFPLLSRGIFLKRVLPVEALTAEHENLLLKFMLWDGPPPQRLIDRIGRANCKRRKSKSTWLTLDSAQKRSGGRWRDVPEVSVVNRGDTTVMNATLNDTEEVRFRGREETCPFGQYRRIIVDFSPNSMHSLFCEAPLNMKIGFRHAASRKWIGFAELEGGGMISSVLMPEDYDGEKDETWRMHFSRIRTIDITLHMSRESSQFDVSINDEHPEGFSLRGPPRRTPSTFYPEIRMKINNDALPPEDLEGLSGHDWKYSFLWKHFEWD